MKVKSNLLNLTFRSQNPAAKEYFLTVAAYTKELDPTRPITVVLNRVISVSAETRITANMGIWQPFIAIPA